MMTECWLPFCLSISAILVAGWGGATATNLQPHPAVRTARQR
jgi:hypothetical protein